MNTTLDCDPAGGAAQPARDRSGNEPPAAAAGGPDLLPLMALLLARVLDLDQPTDRGGSR